MRGHAQCETRHDTGTRLEADVPEVRGERELMGGCGRTALYSLTSFVAWGEEVRRLSSRLSSPCRGAFPAMPKFPELGCVPRVERCSRMLRTPRKSALG